MYWLLIYASKYIFSPTTEMLKNSPNLLNFMQDETGNDLLDFTLSLPSHEE